MCSQNHPVEYKVVIGVAFPQESASWPEACSYFALSTIKTKQTKNPKDLLSESVFPHVLFGYPDTRLSLSGALQGDGPAQLEVGETEAGLAPSGSSALLLGPALSWARRLFPLHTRLSHCHRPAWGQPPRATRERCLLILPRPFIAVALVSPVLWLGLGGCPTKTAFRPHSAGKLGTKAG